MHAYDRIIESSNNDINNVNDINVNAKQKKNILHKNTHVFCEKTTTKRDVRQPNNTQWQGRDRRDTTL